MRCAVFFAFSLLGSLAVATGSMAQPLPPAPSNTLLNVHNINFDLWCQETQKLPPERCDKRLPEDEKAYESYVDTVGRYEVPYLEQRQRDQFFNRVIMHSDPTENPVQHPQQPPAPNP